jgi:hypothetical protein
LTDNRSVNVNIFEDQKNNKIPSDIFSVFSWVKINDSGCAGLPNSEGHLLDSELFFIIIYLPDSVILKNYQGVGKLKESN